MLKTRSLASLRREQKRNSPETIAFRNKVNELLKGTNPEIEYAIKRDLGSMTNMPFYKERPKRIRLAKEPVDLICEYAELFMTCDDQKFIVELVRKLSINQSQTIRKAAPRIGKKKDIWEHAIPTKIIVAEIIQMILRKDVTDLRKLLNIYRLAGQRSLTKEQNKLLDKYRSSMPHGWDWRNENVDHLARHTAVGIIHS